MVNVVRTIFFTYLIFFLRTVQMKSRYCDASLKREIYNTLQGMVTVMARNEGRAP